MAMLLVIITMVMAVILAVTFLAGQSTSTGIEENVRWHNVARYIAESALAAGLHHISADANWRSDSAGFDGVTDYSLAGGNYTIQLVDGEYVNGVLQGDGNLTNNTTDPATLTVLAQYHGVTHEVRALITPGSSGGGGPSLAVTGSIALSGSASVDGFDSSQGPYGGTNRGLPSLFVSTNSTAARTISLTGSSTINGSAYVGPGANPSTVVYTSGTSAVTGTTQALAQAVAITNDPLPSGLPSSAGNKTVKNTSITFSTNQHFGSLTLSGNHSTIYVTGHVVIQCDSDVNLTSSSQIIIGPGSSLQLFVGGNFSASGASQINTDSGDPTRLRIQMTGSSSPSVSVSGSSGLCAQVVNPQGDLALTGATQFYGTFGGQQCTLTGSAKFHADVHGGASGGSSASSSPSFTWQEQP